MNTIPMRVAIASDGERIAYNSHGKGNTKLVFIHGWNCDSRYWTNQISRFSQDYGVITVDLVGQGHSSTNRKEYTIDLFAEDIKAVFTQENVESAILIGHSLAGAIIAKCAQVMPERVISIIGIDTLHDVGETISQESLDEKIKALSGNFVPAMQRAVRDMFIGNEDKELISWIKEDMSSTPKNVAINTYRNFKQRSVTGEATDVFIGLSMPVITINGPLLPTNVAANHKHIMDYTNIYIEDVGHFPMLENPTSFNARLLEALELIDASSNQVNQGAGPYSGTVPNR